MQEVETKTNLFGWWKKVMFENYANFKGRARRAEYWYFTLATLVLLIPFYVIGIVGIATDSSVLSTLGFVVYGLGALAIFIPSLAVGVRRLHDLNKSGWYYLFVLIPFVGSIIVLVWFCTEGNRFTNNYGDDPKSPAGPEFDFEQQAGTASV